MKQYTIGLIIDELDHEYQMKTWQGVFDEAKDQGINVISFVGKRLDSPSGFEAKANIVYDLVTTKRIDGVVILSAAVGSSADPASFERFMKKFSGIPVVSIGVTMPGTSAVLVDNYRGMYDAIDHLIVEHKITEIAFISGPENNEESNIRRKAYMDALTAHNIKVDPALSVCGNFTTESGAEAVHELINVRKKKIRGIGAANDYMAFGAIEELHRHGLSVPNDVAVIGFDNVETAITATPPLTTVKQPIYLEGREAVKLLLSKMNGSSAEESITMLTQVEIRQSCGCFASEKISVNKSEIASVDKSSKKQKNSSADIVPIDEDIKDLYLQLTNDVNARSCEVFLPLFYSSIRAIADTGWDPAVLYGRISRLRKQAYAVYPDNESIYFAESLLHEARTMVGAKTEQLQILAKLNADSESSLMHFIGQRLLTSYRIEDMYEVLKQEFPRIGINSCGISFFSERTDLRVGFSFTEKSIQNKEGTVYPLNDILPDSLWPASPFNMVVLPLFFRNEQLGIVVLPVSPRNGEIYEIIGREIGSSVKATRLYEEQSQSQNAMRAKSDKIQSLISPMLETIRRISDVSRQKISLVEGLSSRLIF
ncbi:MAG TPA: substrate-binding domain-containing protein [Spirochaetota bacterium]|nr:substrate-binding domain-containing protein [Spirochaetota bacterium]